MFSRAGDCYAESSSDEERDERDAAVVAAALSAARAATAAAHPAARASRGRRHGVAEVRAGREDGREVPIGFARWESPAIDPAGFAWGSLGGWRVAVPRPPGPDPGDVATRARFAAVFARLAAGGPAAAGYVRVGDALVPAALTPGERATLAYSAARPDSPPPADPRW